tara:strand:+ start:75 stop:686 length:612 start_codon:yes stop_codon:yes gene_type:complete
MGSIKLPHASGNSMSIAAPATNPASDLELKLPATVGTAGQVLANSSTPGTLEFAGNTPMFLAAPTIAQTGLSSASNIKADFTEIYDPQGTYSSGRFTPGVAGYYQYNASVFIENTTSATNAIYNTRLQIYKNGSVADTLGGRGWHQDNAGGDHWQPSISGIIYLDADDYIEVYAYCGTLSSQNWALGSSGSGGNFSAFRLLGV